MWIFLRDSFLSIVQHGDEPRLLQVRARIRDDIERIFPESYVSEDTRGDYRFCATISRDRVAHVIANRVQHIDYGSLNEQVRTSDRSNAYDKAYSIMLEEQVNRYGTELDLPGYVQSFDIEADAPEASLAAAILAKEAQMANADPV